MDGLNRPAGAVEGCGGAGNAGGREKEGDPLVGAGGRERNSLSETLVFRVYGMAACTSPGTREDCDWDMRVFQVTLRNSSDAGMTCLLRGWE